MKSAGRFIAFAWFVLAYNMGVILFGAWVRITGSGAGCGQHWPTCHGDVVPRPEQTETMIEFTHRATSGIALLLVIGLLVWAVRRFPKGHEARRGAWMSMIFIIIEALLGAGLVLFGLVEDNDSAARAIAMSLHLVNTMMLTFSMLYTAWAATTDRPVRPDQHAGWFRVLLLGAATILFVSMTGAVTALGDTVFPVETTGTMSLRERFGGAYSTHHFLGQLRVVHPFVAVAAGLFLATVGSAAASIGRRSGTTRAAFLVVAAVILQLMIGVANVLLSAPGWLQIVHLLFAEGVWLLFGWMALAVLSDPREE